MSNLRIDWLLLSNLILIYLAWWFFRRFRGRIRFIRKKRKKMHPMKQKKLTRQRREWQDRMIDAWPGAFGTWARRMKREAKEEQTRDERETPPTNLRIKIQIGIGACVLVSLLWAYMACIAVNTTARILPIIFAALPLLLAGRLYVALKILGIKDEGE